jgi:hypothetical protein
VEAGDGNSGVWTWRVLGPAGNLEATSEPHMNYGAAVTNAIQHGFLPSSDHWAVITRAGVTRFEPAGTSRPHGRLERAQPGASIDGKAIDS